MGKKNYVSYSVGVLAWMAKMEIFENTDMLFSLLSNLIACLELNVMLYIIYALVRCRHQFTVLIKPASTSSMVLLNAERMTLLDKTQ